MPHARGYEEIPEGQRGAKKQHGHSAPRSHHTSHGSQSLRTVLVIAAVFAVCFQSDMKMSKGVLKGPHIASMKSASINGLDLKPGGGAARQAHPGPPSPRTPSAITPTEVEETVDFKLPKNAKPGQILHIVVPGQHELQAVRVPPGAKAGMMLSVKVPKTALEEEAAGEGEGAGAGEGEGEGEARAGGEETVVEEVEEDAEIVEEDVVFTWTHFFLLIFFVGLGTMIVFYFVKGVTVGFGPLDVDSRKFLDHPCRFADRDTQAKSEAIMMARREAGGDLDTPITTPRSGADTPHEDAPSPGKKHQPPAPKEETEKPKAGRQVRAMGRQTVFTRQSEFSASMSRVTQSLGRGQASEEAVEKLQDEGRDMQAAEYQRSSRDAKESSRAVPQGRARAEGETARDGMDGMLEEASSHLSDDADMEWASTQVLAEVWERGKWLVVLMIFQSIASMVLAQFEDLIKAHVVIALFLTMLIGSGGNAGGQSVAKAIHEIAVRGRTNGDWALINKVLKKQLAVALWLGLILGWAAWVRVWIFHGGYENSMAISMSCAIIVFSSVLLGAVLPYGMLCAGLDEIHSGAVIQVLMDIYGVSVTCLVCWSMWG